MNVFPHTPEGQPDPAASAAGTLELRPTGRVLVIDDDDAVGLVLSRAMARLGFKADIALDGPKGLSLFNTDPAAYGLVLLDFKLPGMDSRTVYREVRGRRPDLPVILMSGYNKQEALEGSAGMDLAGFLHKPFTMQTLASALRCAA
jgi:two-component system cell cycle sensor histidine kinase/response regulator CckA